MVKTWVVAFALTALGTGCAKHETSAPHTTLTVDVQGVRTRDVPETDFADGWSLHYDRFWLGPTFGVDETVDHRKDDGHLPIVGAEGYVYGGEAMDLTESGTFPAFGGWVLAGRSTGWGMRLRRLQGLPDGPSSDTALEVLGKATGPAGEVVRFAWHFATDMTFSHCLEAGTQTLLLPDGGELAVHAEIDGATLFGERLGHDTALRFEALATADTDNDGTVTTAELRTAALDELDTSDARYTAPGATSLHDFLTARLAHLIRPSYRCEVTVDACQDRPLAVGVCDDSDLAEKDADRDGLKNCMDDDIDGDGLDNFEDCDAYHDLTSLSLCDGSDLQDKDYDGDGLRNCEDPDIDDDGVSNEHDGRPYESLYAVRKDGAEKR